jgi:hypothetical protein
MIEQVMTRQFSGESSPATNETNVLMFAVIQNFLTLEGSYVMVC